MLFSCEYRKATFFKDYPSTLRKGRFKMEEHNSTSALTCSHCVDPNMAAARCACSGTSAWKLPAGVRPECSPEASIRWQDLGGRGKCPL